MPPLRCLLGLATTLALACGGGAPTPVRVDSSQEQEPEPEPIADVLSPAEVERNKIPERFRQPLVFPEDPRKPKEIVAPTLASLNLSDGNERCPEGNRGVLYVVRDGAATETLDYTALIDGPGGIELTLNNGNSRGAVPLTAIAPTATQFEVWPCQGQPYRPSIPETTYLLKTKGGFGKLVDHTDARRPIVRNVAALVVD